SDAGTGRSGTSRRGPSSEENRLLPAVTERECPFSQARGLRHYRLVKRALGRKILELSVLWVDLRFLKAEKHQQIHADPLDAAKNPAASVAPRSASSCCCADDNWLVDVLNTIRERMSDWSSGGVLVN